MSAENYESITDNMRRILSLEKKNYLLEMRITQLESIIIKLSNELEEMEEDHRESQE